jgi:hypothetical protein
MTRETGNSKLKVQNSKETPSTKLKSQRQFSSGQPDSLGAWPLELLWNFEL